MKKNNEDFLLDFPEFNLPGGNTRSRTVQSSVHTIYLDGEITAPSDYRDAMAVLENAGPHDQVVLSITSGGGRLDSGLMLINGIRACQAPVTAQIHSDCGSMATGVALACDNWQLGEFAYFFIHTATWGTVGKDQEVRSQTDFMSKYVDKFLTSMYTGFLTPKELREVAKGEDKWIAGEELSERLAKYAEYREKKEEKQFRAHQAEMKRLWREMNGQAKSGGKTQAD